LKNLDRFGGDGGKKDLPFSSFFGEKKVLKKPILSSV
jgi:hypothetical protein